MNEWALALVFWVKETAPFAPAAVIAAVLAAFMPKRNGVSIIGNALAAFLATPLFAMLILEHYTNSKVTATGMGIALGVSAYWILNRIPVVLTIALEAATKRIGKNGSDK